MDRTDQQGPSRTARVPRDLTRRTGRSRPNTLAAAARHYANGASLAQVGVRGDQGHRVAVDPDPGGERGLARLEPAAQWIGMWRANLVDAEHDPACDGGGADEEGSTRDGGGAAHAQAPFKVLAAVLTASRMRG